MLHIISSIEKSYGYKGEEGGRSKIFYLTVPKKFVREPFRVSLISGIEKFYAYEGYVTTFFEFFCLAMPKKMQENPSVLCFRTFPVANKFRDEKGGEYQYFPSKFFCLKVPKKAVGESFSLSLISGIEKVWLRG